MRGQVFVQVAAKGVGGGEHLLGGAQRQQAVAIDSFDRDGQFLGRRGHHPWQEETGKVVGHNNARATRQRG